MNPKDTRNTLLWQALLLLVIPLIFEGVIFSQLISLSDKSRSCLRIQQTATGACNIAFKARMEVVAGMSKVLSLAHYERNTRMDTADQEYPILRDAAQKARFELNEFGLNSVPAVQTLHSQYSQIVQSFEEAYLRKTFRHDAFAYQDWLDDLISLATGALAHTDLLVAREKQIIAAVEIRQANLREEINRLAWGNLAVGCFLSALMLWNFNKMIAYRLRIVNENTDRFSRGESLNPPLQGSDKIAELDRTFHAMSESLTHALQLEGEAVRSARDAILVFAEDGRVLVCNAAACNLISVAESRLLKATWTDILTESSVTQLAQMMQNRELVSFSCDLNLRRLGTAAEQIETEWSCRRSIADGSVVCIVHDLTDRRAIERSKQELLATVSHDLRSPLSNILAVHSLMQLEVFGPMTDAAKRDVRSALLTIDSMLQLINNLLDMDRLDASALDLDLQTISLGACWESALEMLKRNSTTAVNYDESATSGTKSENIKLILPEDYGILADQARLTTALFNLLNQRLSQCPVPAEMTVTAARGDNSEIKIFVQDNAPLIAEHQAVDMFNRYTESSPTTGESSTPSQDDIARLSLALCQSVIQLHNGQIEFLPIDGCNRFVITLPAVGDAT